MRKTRCPVCFLRQIIGNAADSLADVEQMIVLEAVKRYAGLEFSATIKGAK